MNLRAAYIRFQRYIHNIFWIMGDRILSLAANFALTVLVARYLGPENYGLYTYAFSMATIFSSAGHLGLSGLVVREIVKRPAERGLILGSTLALKYFGMAIGYLLLVAYSAVYEGIGSPAFLYLAIAGVVLLVKPFEVIDFWFQAFVQAKYVIVARLLGLSIASILKIAFVLLNFGVLYFVVASVIESIIVVLVMILVFQIRSGLSISNWRYDVSTLTLLFRQGWLVYLGSIFAVINLKVDQVMLRWLEGPESVGVYGVAAQLSEAWYFLPTAIVATFFPKLIVLKEENNVQFRIRLQQLFDFLFSMAFFIAVLVTFFAEDIILFFFGAHYSESAAVLTIHIWAGIFVFMRAAFSKWILIENALVFSLVTQGIGAIINIILNYFLIPKIGVEGAAYATLFSYASSSFLSLFLYRKTRGVFFMMLKSIFIFPRLILLVKKK